MPDIVLSKRYAADSDDGSTCLPRVRYAFVDASMHCRMIPGAVGAGPARACESRYLKTVERKPGAGEPVCEPDAGVWLRAFIDNSAPGRIASRLRARNADVLDGSTLPLDRSRLSVDGLQLSMDGQELSVDRLRLSMDGQELSVDG